MRPRLLRFPPAALAWLACALRVPQTDCIVVEHAEAGLADAQPAPSPMTVAIGSDGSGGMLQGASTSQQEERLQRRKAVMRTGDGVSREPVESPVRDFVLDASYFSRPRVALEDEAAGWRFQGPKPLPIPEDSRLSYHEKVEELERVMKKLHGEFWLKKARGYKMLSLARALYYEAQADYNLLTGRGCPPTMECQELPEVPNAPPSSGGSAIAMRGSDGRQQGHSHEDPEVGFDFIADLDRLPGCMSVSQDSNCTEASAHCTSQKMIGLAADNASVLLCACLRRWHHCANVSCPASVNNQPGGFVQTLETYEQLQCYILGDDNVKRHVGFPERMPENITVDELTLTLLQLKSKGDSRRNELAQSSTASSLLHQQVEAELDAGVFEDPAELNAPAGCSLSNPTFLGDGQCDGGTYNTEACNWDGGDCCEAHCRSGRHTCGQNGYDCKGTRSGIFKHEEDFLCDMGKWGEFNDYYEGLRDQLTLGTARIGQERCQHISQEEYENLVQAYNVGILLMSRGPVQINQAAAQIGGRKMIVNCEMWSQRMGNDHFGTIITHEMGHTAGYRHPVFSDGQVYDSQCRNLGEKYCEPDCMEWTTACVLHISHGSSPCGFGGMGCRTTCVKSDYCMSFPERITECFGYQKVHSRGDTLIDSATSVSGSSGWGAAPPRSVIVARLLSVASPLALAALLAQPARTT